MALYVPVDVTSDEEKQFAIGYRPLPIATNEQESYRFERDQHLRPDSSIDTRNGSFVKDFLIATETHYEKIRSGEFSFNNPWLPTNALKLLNKMKGVALTEKELVRLMELVAERACVHFQLTEGRFVAMTFLVELLKSLIRG